jgi:UDP-N-acetyl-D-glucosamine dehydrogenase
VEALGKHGAIALVHDPLFSPEELRDLGFTPYSGGEPVNAAILQADHACYREWDEESFGGAKVIIDGRHVLDPERFTIPVISIGTPRRALP